MDTKYQVYRTNSWLVFCVFHEKDSQYNCVYFNMVLSKFFGQITHHSKHYYCGSFSTELQAAQAVNAKCVELDIPFKNPEVGLLEYEPQVRFI